MAPILQMPESILNENNVYDNLIILVNSSDLRQITTPEKIFH